MNRVTQHQCERLIVDSTAWDAGDYQTEEQVAEAEDESKVLYDGDREFMCA